MQRLKKYGCERAGCMGATIRGILYAVGLFIIPIFPLLALESAKWKGGYTWKRKDMCRDRWKDKKRGLRYGLCMLLSLLLVSQE